MKEIIQLGALDIGVIIIYLLVLIAVATWASYGGKKQGGNLFIANKSLGWFAIGLTMWGTNVGPSMLIANASSGYESGIVAGNFSWYAFPFIMLLAFVFAPRYLSAQVTTLPEYMGRRFGNSTRQYIAWYTLITILISWLGLTLFSGGVFMAQILNLPLWLCIVILVLFAASFAMAGGLKAIAFTNVYQMLLLIAVSVMLLVMAVVKAGGPTEIINSTPASYWKLFQPLDHPDFPWLAILVGYPIMGVWFWCTDQSMVQSVLGAKNLNQGQKGANFVAWLKLIDIPLFIIPGILAFILLPGLQNSTDTYMKLVEHVFPTGLIGLVVVVMTATLISTISSALNSLSAVFTMDIYVRYFNRNADNRRIRSVGRYVVLTGAAVAVFLAIGITKIQGLSFFNIFQSVLGFIAPPMSVAFLFAVLWKRTSREAVNLVLSLGTIFSLGTGVLYYNKLILNNVHFLYVSFLIFVLLSVFVIIYSLIKPKELANEENLTTPVSIHPGKKVIVAWSLLILVMLIMYLIFN